MTKFVIRAGNKKSFLTSLQEVFLYKDLLFLLAYRDFKVRYAQTFLGILWSVIQPLATLLIFIVVFNKVARVETGTIPYPLFALCGMTAWSYFAFVMGQAGSSIIGAQSMIKKVYFPRLIIPLSKSIIGLIDFAINFILLVIMLFIYGYYPSSNVIWLPLFLILSLMAGLSIGIWLSALTVRYRDFQHIIPFMVQLGMYITPVAYPASKISSQYQLIYHLNPMAGVVEGFRWAILGGDAPTIFTLMSNLFVVLLLLSGMLYFNKVEKVMADIL